jgi:hypothetical protein
MYSGKIAVPPGGGGIRKIIIYKKVDLLEELEILFLKNVWNNQSFTTFYFVYII